MEFDSEGIGDHVEDLIEKLWSAFYDDFFLPMLNGFWDGAMRLFVTNFAGQGSEYLLLCLIVCGIAWRFRSWG